jgi:hypothetical protein
LKIAIYPVGNENPFCPLSRDGYGRSTRRPAGAVRSAAGMIRLFIFLSDP